MKKYFAHCTTLNDLKAEYKRLAKINHPDAGAIGQRRESDGHCAGTVAFAWGNAGHGVEIRQEVW